MLKYSIYIVTAVILLASCAKVDIGSPDLKITTSSGSLTYKVGDTINFLLEGNPDNILFYSGEQGHNYAYRDRTSIDNDLEIQFSTWQRYGMPRQNLQLMVSTDFAGVYDVEHIQAAHWEDLTELAAFSPGIANDNFPSGVISLKPYLGADPKSLIYIALKYTDNQKSQGQNNWVIRSFNADQVSPEGQITNMATMSTGGWKAVNVLNLNKVWSITSSQLQMPSSTSVETDNEDWVITRGFNVRAVSPDAGVALKNISTLLPVYQYVYEEPGTYQVVFESSNIRYNGDVRQTKELTIEITP